MKYSEEKAFTLKYKDEYLKGIDSVIKSRQQAAQGIRADYIGKVFDEPERYRQELCEMLGWPLTGHRDGVPLAECEKLSDEAGYSIYRMSIEVVGTLKLTGLFFKIESDQELPLVIVQHGGQGTPELIAGMYGKTHNYNDMLMRVLKRGVHVFAPQLMLWEPKDYGAGFDRAGIDARLKSVGSSIAALEIYALTRALDYFEAQKYVKCFGMVGLSYGGFYTLFTAAVDTRIKSAISCSYFNDRNIQAFTNWLWQGSAYMFNDAEVACLVYPRRLCLQMGDRDELFDSKYSERSFERIKELCKNTGTDWIELIIFDGKHEFYKDDAPIERLINDLKSTS